MAYDNENNWYLDPELDAEDAEMVQTAEKLEQAQLYRMQKRVVADQTKFSQDSWAEALKAADLSQEEYSNLLAQDPETASQLIKESMRAVAKGIAARKGKKPAPKRNEQGQAPAGQPHEKVQAARAVVEKRPLTADEELSILEAVLKG